MQSIPGKHSSLQHALVHPSSLSVALQVADVGLSRPRHLASMDDQMLQHVVPWTAPEMIRNSMAASQAADVYSFGMIMWSAWVRCPPHVNADISKVMVRIMLGQPIRPPIPGESLARARELTCGCCKTNAIPCHGGCLALVLGIQSRPHRTCCSVFTLGASSLLHLVKLHVVPSCHCSCW